MSQFRRGEYVVCISTKNGIRGPYRQPPIVGTKYTVMHTSSDGSIFDTKENGSATYATTDFVSLQEFDDTNDATHKFVGETRTLCNGTVMYEGDLVHFRAREQDDDVHFQIVESIETPVGYQVYIHGHDWDEYFEAVIPEPKTLVAPDVGDDVVFYSSLNDIWLLGTVINEDMFDNTFEIETEGQKLYYIEQPFIRVINIDKKQTREEKRMAEKKEAAENIYENLFKDYIMEFKGELKKKVSEELESVKGTLNMKIQALEQENTNLKKRADKATKEMWESLKQLETKTVVNFGTIEEPKEELVHPAFHKLTKIFGSQKRTYKNVMLVGPAGSGKTHLSSSVAKAMKLDYYPMSVGSQTTKSDLMGFINAKGGYQTTPVREAFENGGILLLDEFDAAHAGVVTILNSLLSNEIVSFPDKQVTKNEKFVVIVACNTYGKGANSLYVGRNKLDAATLDRFITVDVGYDANLENKLIGDKYADILVHIEKIRQNAKDQEINVVISPRASMNAADLIEGGFELKEALEMAVIKGAPRDVRVKLLNGIETGNEDY